MSRFLYDQFLVAMVFFCSTVLLPLYVAFAQNDENQKNLVFVLLQEKKFEEAALEARRAALSSTNAIEQSAFLFLAAYAYSATQDFARAIKMLDKAEDIYPAIKKEALFLRGKIAMKQARYTEALFYFETLLPTITNDVMEKFVRQEIAVSYFMQNNTNATLAAVQEIDKKDNREIGKIIQEFYKEPDKNPMVGGLLGLIPGLGYAYSEEYANALRSFILNGIFIGALIYSGSQEQWGAFAVISFFELTWYSGSIYGGIDAAHRYNRARREKVAATIRGGITFNEIDFSSFPKISLQFRF